MLLSDHRPVVRRDLLVNLSRLLRLVSVQLRTSRDLATSDFDLPDVEGTVSVGALLESHEGRAMLGQELHVEHGTDGREVLDDVALVDGLALVPAQISVRMPVDDDGALEWELVDLSLQGATNLRSSTLVLLGDVLERLALFSRLVPVKLELAATALKIEHGTISVSRFLEPDEAIAAARACLSVLGDLAALDGSVGLREVIFELQLSHLRVDTLDEQVAVAHRVVRDVFRSSAFRVARRIRIGLRAVVSCKMLVVNQHAQLVAVQLEVAKHLKCFGALCLALEEDSARPVRSLAGRSIKCAELAFLLYDLNLRSVEAMITSNKVAQRFIREQLLVFGNVVNEGDQIPHVRLVRT